MAEVYRKKSDLVVIEEQESGELIRKKGFS
jgi:hypothetical protein